MLIEVEKGNISQEQFDFSTVAAYGAKLLNEVENEKDGITGTNCGELAAMGFVKYGRMENNPTIERMRFDKMDLPANKAPDHAFLVINRDKDTDPGDYQSWNEGAFVLDIYARAVYPASEFNEKMVEGQPDFSKGHSKTELVARHPANTPFPLVQNIEDFPDGPVAMPIETDPKVRTE